MVSTEGETRHCTGAEWSLSGSGPKTLSPNKHRLVICFSLRRDALVVPKQNIEDRS